MRYLVPLLILLLSVPLGAAAQRKAGAKARTAQKATEPTPEEIAAQQLEEARQLRIDELLTSTRSITFIDSLVVDKDNYLSHLRLNADAGRYTDPQTLFADHSAQYVTGRAAFINSLASAVYFSIADSTGVVALHAAYRNGGQWGAPQLLRGLEGQDYHDNPFMLSDGTTLYYAAQASDGIGGLDLYVTRYNPANRQFVRPENLGFPFNSTANDYLLAIDESSGVGVLVTDRRQPDDKVCLYWFIADDAYRTVPYDADDEASLAALRRIADITSIADTQHDAALIEAVRRRWHDAIAADNQAKAAANATRFVVSDAIVYTNLSQFRSAAAREQAAAWQAQQQQLDELRCSLDELRRSYATTRSEKQAKQIRNAEVQIQQLERTTQQSAKDYRRLEQQTLSGQ